MWQTEDGKKYTDAQVVTWIKSELEASMNDGIQRYFAIGTDSQRHGLNYKFVKVIGVHRVGRGGYYIYSTEYEAKAPYKGKQNMRMFREVEISCDLADWILENTEQVVEVHIDASPENKGEFTSRFSNQLVGYVESRGYKGLLKPESYIAACVSDRHAKT